MIALMLLLVAAVLLNASNTPTSGSGSATSSASTLDYHFGLFCCLTASGLSGLSGALVQRALSGAVAQNPFLYTAELATYGIVFLLVTSLFREKERDIMLSGNLFTNWEVYTLIPVTANVSIYIYIHTLSLPSICVSCMLIILLLFTNRLLAV